MGGGELSVVSVGCMKALSTLCLGTVLLAGLPPALAHPTGGNVVGGAATISSVGSTTTIHQTTDRAVINWQDFSIGAGELTRFVQPGMTSATLNRVLGGNPTEILGRLEANGSVFVLNPNGVLVGREGVINTGGTFAAATRDVSDADFLGGGNLRFSGRSAGGVMNLGVITAGGDAIFIGRTVRNAGTITAGAGTAALAAGDEVFLQRQGDDTIRVQFTIPGLSGDVSAATGVENSGVIRAAQAELAAAGGNVYALAIRAGGEVSATGVAERGGRVYLTADQGAIEVDGKVSATRSATAGGEIAIGGGLQGRDASLVNAATVTVHDNARLSAGAAGQEGGQVVVWADGHTRFAGQAETGREGFVEVSGRRTLDFTGLVNTRGGRLLLDPTDLTIDDAQLATIGSQLANGSVIVSATGDLTYAASGSVAIGANPGTGRGYGLSLVADQSLRFAPDSRLSVTGTDVSVDLYANGGDIEFGSGSVLGLASGTVSLAATRNLAFGASASVTVAGSGSIYGRADAQAFINLPGGGYTTVDPDRVGGLSFGSAATIDAPQIQFFAPRATDYTNTSFYTPAAITYNTAPSYTLPGSGLWFLSDQNGNFGGGGPTPATLTITANNASRLYGAANPIFTANYAGFVNGDTPSVVTGLQFATTATLGSNVGNYAITPFGATVPATYTTVNYVPGTLTITPAPLLIVGNNVTRQTGAANPAFTARFTGLVNGDTSAVVSGLQFSTTADTTSPAGTYNITPFGASALNYDISYGPGTLSVLDQIVAFITLQPQDASRAYAAANPVFSLRPVTGLQSGDSVASVDFSTNATLGSNVGTYELHASNAVMNTPSGYYYNINYLPATFTITPAPLTLRIDNATRPTGQANPAFSAQLSGLAPFDLASSVLNYSLATTATADSPRGTYPITATTQLFSPNYTLSVVPGQLRLNQSLVIQPADATRTYGASNPAFSLRSVTGLLAGDSVTGAQFSTTATIGSNVGNYAITASDAVVNNPSGEQYALSYLPGTLSITPAPLTLRVDPVFHTTAQPRPPLTAQVFGLVNGDTAAANIGYSLFAEQRPGELTGRFPIGADIDFLSPNYTAEVVPGTLTVHPATGVVEDLTRTEFVVTAVTPEGIAQGYFINRPPSYFGVPGRFSEQIYTIVREFGQSQGWDAVTNNDIKVYLDTFGWNLDFQASMMPFTISLAKRIRTALDAGRDVSASDRAFLEYIESEIQRQRIAAAEKAMADYRAWQADNEARRANRGRNLMNLMNYGWDEVPPPHFLASAQSGLSINPNEFGLWASMLQQVGKGDVVHKILEEAWKAGEPERARLWREQNNGAVGFYQDPPFDYETTARMLGLTSGPIGTSAIGGQVRISADANAVAQTGGAVLTVGAGVAAGTATAITIGSIMPFAGTTVATATTGTLVGTAVGGTAWLPGAIPGTLGIATTTATTATTTATTTTTTTLTSTSTYAGAISTGTIAVATVAVSAITIVASVIFNKALQDIIEITTTDSGLNQALVDARQPVNINQLSDDYLMFALASMSSKQLQPTQNLSL
jgi:filamentous hemagglutinin family protein